MVQVAAILISALLFGYAHISNPGASIVTAFGKVGGTMYGIAFLGGRNIWLPLGMHFAWNSFRDPFSAFLSGAQQGGLIVQQVTGSDLLMGGAWLKAD